jgi:hypothetical protein
MTAIDPAPTTRTWSVKIIIDEHEGRKAQAQAADDIDGLTHLRHAVGESPEDQVVARQ